MQKTNKKNPVENNGILLETDENAPLWSLIPQAYFALVTLFKV